MANKIGLMVHWTTDWLDLDVNPDQNCCVEFLDKTLYSHKASLQIGLRINEYGQINIVRATWLSAGERVAHSRPASHPGLKCVNLTLACQNLQMLAKRENGTCSELSDFRNTPDKVAFGGSPTLEDFKDLCSFGTLLSTSHTCSAWSTEIGFFWGRAGGRGVVLHNTQEKQSFDIKVLVKRILGEQKFVADWIFSK